MIAQKNKKSISHNKHFIYFAQILILSMLFLFVVNHEFVLFIKEIINSLPVGSNFIEAIAVKGYIIFNAFANSPSIMALCLLVLQVMFISCSLETWKFIFFSAIKTASDTIFIKLKKIILSLRLKNNIYLTTLRLRP